MWTVPPGLTGSPTPRMETARAPGSSTLGPQAVLFAEEILGVQLLDWQKHFLDRALELKPDGTLRFRTVLLVVARQNGKTFVMIVLALYYMFVLAPGDLVLGTAQDLTTSVSTWSEALELVRSCPDLADLIKGNPVKIRGAESFRLQTGSEWRVAASNSKGGRGQSASLVLMDELREQRNWDAWNAVSNTVLTRSSGLVLAVSNAGDPSAVVLRSIRSKALRSLGSTETSTLLVEWSAHEDADLDDPTEIALANPAVGSNMSWDALFAIRESATDTSWKTENMGIWEVTVDSGPWGRGVWEACLDPSSAISPDSPLVVAVDVSYDSATSYIAVAGNNREGKVHVEIAAMRAGDAWVAPWLDKRFEALGAAFVVLQGRGAGASSLVERFEELGIPVRLLSGQDLTEAHMSFFKAVRDGLVAHIGQAPLDASADGTVTKATGDRFLFDRRRSPGDAAPITAAAHAYAGLVGILDHEEPAVSAYDTDYYRDQGVIFA